MKRIIEVCAGSYQDCLAAYRGGAQRAELNSALSIGGLTPSVAALRRAKQETSLKIICMVRPRAAGFCYDEADVQIMMDDARILLQEGADGIAFGFLDEHGRVAAEDTAAMCGLIHSFGKEAVFHRAFDVCEDPFAAMQTLIRTLQERFGKEIEILAGSGVNAENARSLMEQTGIWQVHSSCKDHRCDPTTEKGPVSYAYLNGPHRCDHDVVSETLVRSLVQAVQED